VWPELTVYTRPSMVGKFELTCAFDRTFQSVIRRLSRQIAAPPFRIGKTGELRRDLFQDIPELSFVYLNADEYEDACWRVVITTMVAHHVAGATERNHRGKEGNPKTTDRVNATGCSW